MDQKKVSEISEVCYGGGGAEGHLERIPHFIDEET